MWVDGGGGGGNNLLQDLLPGPCSTLLTTQVLTYPGRDPSFNEGAAVPLADGTQRISVVLPLCCP